MEESLAYQEERLPGKGISCIATKDIKKGSLVLRESPQLFLTDQMVEDLDNLEKNVIESFLGMSRENRKKYMRLHNIYRKRENWSEEMKNDLQERAAKLAKNEMVVSNLSMEKALKVWGIYKTNTFTNGVYLKMSRFNHSCQPNTELFWNQETDTQDVRALRKIKQGEEITHCYTSLYDGMWSRDERRIKLKSDYNFDCNCEGCDITEEQIQQETDNLDSLIEEAGKRKGIQTKKIMAEGNYELQLNLARMELESLKQMYKLAKTIQPMNRGWILDNIVVLGFDLSCSGFLDETRFRNRRDQKKVWMKDAQFFAEDGLKAAKILFGQDSLWTQRWKERSTDPMKFYKKENTIL